MLFNMSAHYGSIQVKENGLRRACNAGVHA